MNDPDINDIITGETRYPDQPGLRCWDEGRRLGSGASLSGCSVPLLLLVSHSISKKSLLSREEEEMFAVLSVSQKLLGRRRWSFQCQAPGQTANNEGLMDGLYPTTTEMIPPVLQSFQACFREVLMHQKTLHC